MKNLTVYSIGFLFLTVSACTSLSTGQEAVVEGEADQNRRVRYQNNTTTAPLRQSMDEQASEINRKRNIEDAGSNNPATTPPDLRPQRVPNAPVDSAIHNVNRPIPTRVRPIDN